MVKKQPKTRKKEVYVGWFLFGGLTDGLFTPICAYLFLYKLLFALIYVL